MGGSPILNHVCFVVLYDFLLRKDGRALASFDRNIIDRLALTMLRLRDHIKIKV